MNAFGEDDLLPISALQHLAFCLRQCALIHIERIWVENRLTAEGRLLHEQVHEKGTTSRIDTLLVRGLSIRSLDVGIVGIADMVEFHRISGGEGPAGVELPGAEGRWRPLPVEYKRGRPKGNSCDEIQLCAQAICLEEMLGTTIEEGSLFYGTTRRRCDVRFDPALRDETAEAVNRLRRLISSEQLPTADPGKKCRLCSLRDECLPGIAKLDHSASDYVSRTLRQLCSKVIDEGDGA